MWLHLFVIQSIDSSTNTNKSEIANGESSFTVGITFSSLRLAVITEVLSLLSFNKSFESPRPFNILRVPINPQYSHHNVVFGFTCATAFQLAFLGTFAAAPASVASPSNRNQVWIAHWKNSHNTSIQWVLHTFWILDLEGVKQALVDALLWGKQFPHPLHLRLLQRRGWVKLNFHQHEFRMPRPLIVCFFGATVMKMEFSPTPLPRRPLIWSSFHRVFDMPGQTNSNSFWECCQKNMHQDWHQCRARESEHPSRPHRSRTTLHCSC